MSAGALEFLTEELFATSPPPPNRQSCVNRIVIHNAKKDFNVLIDLPSDSEATWRLVASIVRQHREQGHSAKYTILVGGDLYEHMTAEEVDTYADIFEESWTAGGVHTAGIEALA